MIFKTFGSKQNKAILLLHGGGLSWWSLKPQIDILQKEYYMIIAVIDGHGEDAHNTFVSISVCADKIIQYIESNLNGHIFCIGGLSIGAQIAVDILVKKNDIAEKAVIESCLIYPIKFAAALAKTMYDMSYWMIKKRWFSNVQAKALFVPDDMLENYYEDSCRMSTESLINMTISNSTYSLPENLYKSNAAVLIAVGGKELPVMIKSAKLLNSIIKNSSLMVLDKYGHGEFSLKYPSEYSETITRFLQRQDEMYLQIQNVK